MTNDRQDQKKKIAISGSTGLIGNAFRCHLESQGHQVVPVVRIATGRQPPSSGTPAIDWDPVNGFPTPEQLNGIDAFVHLAGKSIGDTRWTEAEKNAIRDSRVQATRILAEQLSKLEYAPPTILSASAIGLYGDRGDAECTEVSEPGSDFLASVAQDWESACQPLRDRGLRVIHPRFGIVLSQGGGALAKMLPLFRWGLGGRLGAGSQYWSWISLNDTVRALDWLVQSPSCYGPYNLVSPSPATNLEFTRALAGALRRPAFLPAPEFALRAALGEMADALLLTSCRSIPERLLDAGFEFDDTNLSQFLSHEVLSD